MPNTKPAIDCAAVARDVLALGEKAMAEIAVAGAITVGRRGERLAPMGEMAELGVRLFTDDGRGVQHGGLMRRALEYASGLGVVLAQHCEDEQLAAGGHMHEGALSSRLGIAGQPALAEEMMLARDLALVRLTGARMHFLHLSTAGSVEMIRAAKAEGLDVTAEVTPHHLALCDAAVQGFDPVYKVNPPLRTVSDVARGAGRASPAGVIDAVATDHAPHAPERKEEPFDEAPAGMLGLETALAVAYGAMCTASGNGVTTRPTAGCRRARSRPCRCGPARRRSPGSRPASPGSTRRATTVQAATAATAARSGPVRSPTSWSSTRAPNGSSTRSRQASRSRNTPYARTSAHRQGPPHPACRRGGGHRRRSAAMSVTAGQMP